ncbi:MAG: hypothetical protein RR202_07110 [Bacteroidales bacterium]
MLKKLLKRRCLSLFLFTLFVGYVGCVFAFRHVHIIDGVRIVHAHPGGGEDHGHTKAEVYIFAEISDLTTDFSFFPCFDFHVSQSLLDELRNRLPESLSLGFVHQLSLRGPPLF